MKIVCKVRAQENFWHKVQLVHLKVALKEEIIIDRAQEKYFRDLWNKTHRLSPLESLGNVVVNRRAAEKELKEINDQFNKTNEE